MLTCCTVKQSQGIYVMKKLLLTTAFLLSVPVAAAEVSSPYLVKAGVTNSVKEDVSNLDARGLVDLAGQSAIEFLNDGSISQQEAEALLVFLDIDRVARFTLGRHGRSLTDEQFGRFKVAFEKYAAQQFRSHLSGFEGADIKIVETVNRKPHDAVVKTEVKTADGDIQKVNWRVLKRQDQWNVVDVEALGFWFAIEQRAQFSSTLDQSNGDIEVLIETLENKK